MRSLKAISILPIVSSCTIEGTGGLVTGKRCGTSQNIGSKARKQAMQASAQPNALVGR